MTAPTVWICECEHPKSQHKREMHGCRALDCGCAKFEADMAASAKAQGVEQKRILTVVAEVCEDQAAQARAELGEEPRSGHPVLRTLRADVARAEQERDEATTKLVIALADLERERHDRAAADEQVRTLKHSQSLDAVALKTELEQLRQASDRELRLLIPRAEQAESTLRRVEEAAGRDIADQFGDDLAARVADLRAGRDQATARALELASRVAELEALLEHAEQYARDLQDNGDVAVRAEVIDEQVRYLCEACGARYGIAYDDHEHGPLTPVTVTIARQGAPTA